MALIEPNKKYSISEVVGLGLIPGIKDYYTLYKLVAIMNIAKNDNTKYGKRDWSKLYGETTKTTLKAEQIILRPWTKVRRLVIRGSEILKFKKIHKML